MKASIPQFCLITLFALAFPISGLAGEEAKKLIVNQEEIDCELQGSAAVTSEGDLAIEVQDPDCLGQGGLAMTSLVLNPRSVSPGDAFTASWASIGADACALTLPSGWSAPNVGTSDEVTLDVPSESSTGEKTVSVECSSSNANVDPVFADAFLQVGSSDVPDRPDMSVTVVDNVAPGEIRIDWSGSSNSSSCEASSDPTLSDWDGDVSTDSDQQKTISDLEAGGYNLSLTCSNSNGESDPANASATISGSEQCAGREPPSGWTRLGDPGTPACLNDGFSWDPSKDCRVWWEVDDDGERLGLGRNPFYESGGATYRIAAAGRGSPKQYLAIRLNTFKTVEEDGGETVVDMPTNESGRWSAQAPNTFATAAKTLVTISSCPGDFHQDEVMDETGCYGAQNAIFQNFRWGGTASGETCQLESGRTYYLNIIPTLSAPGTDPDDLDIDPNCDGDACGMIYSWSG